MGMANSEQPAHLDKNAEMELMLDLVARYSSQFPVHTADTAFCDTLPHDVIVVTGTTGAYGSALLSELVKTPQVSLVYALNRKGKGSIHLHTQKLP